MDEEAEVDVPTNLFIDVNEEMFVGRQTEMAQLLNKLNECGIAVLSGMGGAGKTTLASLFASKNYQKYRNGIFFVDASSVKMIPLHFAEIAEPGILNLTTVKDSHQTKMRLVFEWLKINSNYLLIYDAADDIEALNELFGVTIKLGYIPEERKADAHVLITTRCVPEHLIKYGITAPVCLEDLSSEDCYEFLKKRVYHEEEMLPEEIAVLGDISENALLSRLPLFLEQTGSYIRVENLTFKDYLDDLEKKQERSPVGSVAFGDNRQSLDERFTSNFNSLSNRDSNAMTLLEMASFCSSRNIPLGIFTCISKIINNQAGYTDEEIEKFFNHIQKNIYSKVEEQKLNMLEIYEMGGKILGSLQVSPRDINLALPSKDDKYFTIHGVIQEQVRLQLNKTGRLKSVLKILGRGLNEVILSDEMNLSTKKQMLSHVEKCADFISVFWNPKSIEMDMLEIYVDLKLKSAYLFQWYGLFDTTWKILKEVEKDISRPNTEHLWVKYLTMKARTYVSQIKSKESLETAKLGVEHYEKLKMRKDEPEMKYTFAILQKTCHHALIHEVRAEKVDDADVPWHFHQAKQTFEDIMRETKRECEIEYGALLMHHGEYFIYKAWQTELRFEVHLHYLNARKWLREAVHCFPCTSLMQQICKVLIIEVETELKCKTLEDAQIELEDCLQVIEECFGRNHRFNTFVMEKMSDVYLKQGKYAACLDSLRDKFERQKSIYKGEDGMLFFNETYDKVGKAYEEIAEKAGEDYTHQSFKDVLPSDNVDGRIKEIQNLISKAKITCDKLALPKENISFE